jgi:pyruvate/2-oxoglutarate dehydrogenase complex dihydrolipoamide acyltransferase (E2) component
MGQSIAEGTVVKWHKEVGDVVQADDLLVEVESDKVTFEVGSPVNGTVTAITVDEGDMADVGAAIATIDSEEEAPANQSAIAAQSNPSETASPNFDSF